MIILPAIWTFLLILQLIGGRALNAFDVIVTVGAWALVLFLMAKTRKTEPQASPVRGPETDSDRS